MHPPLLITADQDLLDDLHRLAAAAGVVLDVAHDPSSALRQWVGAPLVLVGQDLARSLVDQSPPRRAEVFLVGRGEPDFRAAVTLGAHDVLPLPEAEDRVVEALADVGDGGSRSALTIGVVGGSGGVGSSTLACAAAAVGARSGDSLVMDMDPWGSGVERILGIELHGLTWRELVGSRGRLGSRALREALPRRGGLAVLGWGDARVCADDVAVREVLSAARRGHDLVVLDLPRQLDPLSAELAGRCDHLVLVGSCSLGGAAAAMRALGFLRSVSASVHLVARTLGGSVSPEALAGALDLPLLASLGSQKGLTEQLDLGLGPLQSRRGPIVKAATQVLERLAR